jgi:hypothetical protein
MQSGSRIAALAFTLAVVAMGGTGLWYMTELVRRLDESAVVEHALRNHLEADMMHDALRGDVLAAQYQTLDRRAATIRGSRQVRFYPLIFRARDPSAGDHQEQGSRSSGI